ncbi:MAG: endolytic transglycosylase MltG [Dehalococcoidia bacterium]|nr:MAG: endolytic transglycosylase MltG [Dehalococcoidia bacterium]
MSVRRADAQLALLAVALAVLIAVAWRSTPGVVARALTGLEPSRATSDQSVVRVTVPSGANAEQIVTALDAAGAVSDAAALRVLMRLTGVGADLQAGRYQFRKASGPAEVLQILRGGPNGVQRVTVREGLRVEEIGALVVHEGLATPEEWAGAIAKARPEAFLAQRPKDSDLTGYLFPASYDIDRTTNAETLIQAMLDAFSERVAPLSEEALASGLTLHQALTLASIVEREAVSPDERATVAAVFRNRLRAGIGLQADPTVQFALTRGERGVASIAQEGYWKKSLTPDDLRIDSPYNTYLMPGLPPGPIANPGLAAIEAAIRPDPVDYLYFVAAPSCDGKHLFATTLDQHNHNVALFRASPCAR